MPIRAPAGCNQGCALAVEMTRGGPRRRIPKANAAHRVAGQGLFSIRRKCAANWAILVPRISRQLFSRGHAQNDRAGRRLFIAAKRVKQSLRIGRESDRHHLVGQLRPGIAQFAAGLVQANRLVLSTRGQRPAVGAPGDGVDAVLMTRQHSRADSFLDIPDAGRLVERAAEHTLAIRAPGDPMHDVRVPFEHVQRGAAFDIPDSDVAVMAGRSQFSAVRRESHIVDRVSMTFEAVNQSSLGHRDQMDAVVVQGRLGPIAAGRQPFAVRGSSRAKKDIHEPPDRSEVAALAEARRCPGPKNGSSCPSPPRSTDRHNH